jgi:hypothetical protein
MSRIMSVIAVKATRHPAVATGVRVVSFLAAANAVYAAPGGKYLTKFSVIGGNSAPKQINHYKEKTNV